VAAQHQGVEDPDHSLFCRVQFGDRCDVAHRFLCGEERSHTQVLAPMAARGSKDGCQHAVVDLEAGSSCLATFVLTAGRTGAGSDPVSQRCADTGLIRYRRRDDWLELLSR